MTGSWSIERAREALFDGDPQVALEILDDLVDRDLGPHLVEVHHGRALALERLGRFDEGIAACIAALDLEPRHRGALMTLGSLYLAERKWLPAWIRFSELAEVDEHGPLSRHLLTWIDGRGDGDGPAVPSRAEIVELFDGYAPSFESDLVANLDYQGLEMTTRALEAVGVVPEATRHVIDLGCGTGLLAPLLRPFARSLIGIDVAPAMVEIARATGLYDMVYVADIVYALAIRPAHSTDLMVASDVFHYFGDIEAVLVEAARVLTPGGRLTFCAELLDDPDADHFEFSPRTRRCAYGERYVRRLATAAGLEVERLEREPMRRESQGWAMAFSGVLRAPLGTASER